MSPTAPGAPRGLRPGDLGPICYGCGDQTVVHAAPDGGGLVALCFGHTPTEGRLFAINAQGDYLTEDGVPYITGIFAPFCPRCEEPMQVQALGGQEALQWQCATARCPAVARTARPVWYKLGRAAQPVDPPPPAL